MSCKDSILTTIGLLEGKATTALNKAKEDVDPFDVKEHIKEAALWLQAAKIVRETHKVDEPVAQITRREEHHYHYPRWNIPYQWSYTAPTIGWNQVTSYTTGGLTSFSTLENSDPTSTTASYHVNLDRADPDYNLLKMLSDHLAS